MRVITWFAWPRVPHVTSVTCEVRYRKGVPWALTKNIIERNTYDGVQNYVNHVFSNVRKHLASQPPQPDQPDQPTALAMSEPPAAQIAAMEPPSNPDVSEEAPM